MTSEGVATGSSHETKAGTGSLVAPVGRVDIARKSGNQLFLYGWILGFGDAVSQALLHCGATVIDLRERAIRLPRPDVTQHFSSQVPPDNHQHGFYLLVDLSDAQTPFTELRLSLTSQAGLTAEGRWPVLSEGGPPVSPEMFNGLVRQLPEQEAWRLAAFAKLALPVAMSPGPEPETPTRFEVELCCLLGGELLIVAGVLADPTNDVVSLKLAVATCDFDLLALATPIRSLQSGLDRRTSGFMFAAKLPVHHGETEAMFAIGMGSKRVQFTRQLVTAVDAARAQLLAFAGRMDAEGLIQLVQQVKPLLHGVSAEKSIAELLGLLHDQAVERLPTTFQQSDPTLELHVDHGIRVGNEGLFLVGWFYADPAVAVRLTCHSTHSETQPIDISGRWIRCPRPDVTRHLANRSILAAGDAHGFLCLAPMPHPDRPCYLEVAAAARRVVRLANIKLAEAGTAMQAIRMVLSSFDARNDRLRVLLDEHVGPAVTAIWATRPGATPDPMTQSFGTQVTEPAVSVIVYGRHERAKEQLALFANDPDFKHAELIYVTDDPAAQQDFAARFQSLYESCHTPFVAVFTGGHTGFAAANNCAARYARGSSLLLMGSGVVPKRPGWLGQLLNIYGKLDTPGLVGAKLTDQNGKVRHAGAGFGRSADWCDLWTTHQLFEGEDAVGLTGVLEVESVSAACAMIDAVLYRELGGLSEDYIAGGFTDSDLCLRAALAGRRNRVALDIELYDFEPLRLNAPLEGVLGTHMALYDCWLHDHRWARVIESRKKRKTAA